MAVGLGEVVLVPDLMTLGIAFGRTFSSGLLVADGDGDEDEVDAAGEGLGESFALAVTVGDGPGRDAEGLGTDSLGMAATGLSVTFGWSAF